MINGVGHIGPEHWQARQARKQAEQWISNLIRSIRNQDLTVPENTAAYAFAWHRDETGKLLDVHAASVDLLNILRPTVAIARYIVFSALALHQHPEQHAKL